MYALRFIYKGEEIPSFDLCFALDCADKSRLGNLRVNIFDNAKNTVCIDHHITNNGYADINIIKPEATSTGEVLFEVLTECGFSLDSYSAMCLYTAIASDSGCFKYSSTTPKLSISSMSQSRIVLFFTSRSGFGKFSVSG